MASIHLVLSRWNHPKSLGYSLTLTFLNTGYRFVTALVDIGETSYYQSWSNMAPTESPL